MNRRAHPRRPATFGPAALDAHQATPDGDPGARIEAAHTTAAALVAHGRGSGDPQVVARLVRLTDDHGLDDVAELWADLPPTTLPGALWRLYALRAWVRARPHAAARWFDAGRQVAVVDEVVAGVAEPPGPEDVVELADAVLTGAFRGDLDVALERAAAFCRVVSTGRAADADDERTSAAADLHDTGDALDRAAARWRAGELT